MLYDPPFRASSSIHCAAIVVPQRSICVEKDADILNSLAQRFHPVPLPCPCTRIYIEHDAEQVWIAAKIGCIRFGSVHVQMGETAYSRARLCHLARHTTGVGCELLRAPMLPALLL